MTRRMKRSISGLVMVLMAVLFGACAEPTAKPTPDVWMEDAVPAGGTQSTSAGDVWNFVSGNPTPFSGTLAHKSENIAGLHEHWFLNATATLQVNPGDVLYCYVFLDPTNPPQEIMLQWSNTEVGGNFPHRAYWGANQIDFGVDGTPSKRFMGALPPTNQWVRLEVPASLVGTEGKAINGMAFSLFDGVVTWDQAGKFPGKEQRAEAIITIPHLQILGDRRTAPIDARRRALSVVVPITESFFQS